MGGVGEREGEGYGPEDEPLLVDEEEAERASVIDLQHAAEELSAAARDLSRTGGIYLRGRARRNPYEVLGVAAGIGFVLGGGLASRASGFLLAAAGRLLVARVIEEMSAEG